MKKLIIEKRNRILTERKDIIEKIINRYDGNKDKILMDLKDVTFGLKLGMGGNHIWIANEKNVRLAIIYF